MPQKRDYYEVLKVDRSATSETISRAYRKLAVKYHPDTHPGDEQANFRFKEAAEAYEVLSDPEKRARYDQYGFAGVEGRANGFGSAEDIFSAFSDIFGGGMFSDLFGRSSRGRVRKGNDIRVDLELSLEEAASGLQKELEFQRNDLCDECRGSGAEPGTVPETCPTCGGRGQVLQAAGILRIQTTCPHCQGKGESIRHRCSECRGQGFVPRDVALQVSIPPGVDDGMRIRLRNEGEPSPDGGPAGDCYVFVKVARHPLFSRDGNNLIIQMPISYTQAALGAELDVPTLQGRTSLNLPRGTQSGEVFRLPRKGMPDPHGGRTGDLLVQAFIETPKKLDKRQEELLRDLAELEHSQVSPQRKSFLSKIKDYLAHSE